MKTSQAKIIRTHGYDAECGVNGFLASRLRACGAPPLLGWAEPVAGWLHDRQPGRIAGFLPLQRDGGSWPDEVPLAEARLFWADRALHVVAQAKGCRWAEIEELPPADAAGELVMRRSRIVLTVRHKKELQRFGLNAADCAYPDRLELIEYGHAAQQRGWRLLPVSSEGALE